MKTSTRGNLAALLRGINLEALLQFWSMLLIWPPAMSAQAALSLGLHCLCLPTVSTLVLTCLFTLSLMSLFS